MSDRDQPNVVILDVHEAMAWAGTFLIVVACLAGAASWLTQGMGDATTFYATFTWAVLLSVALQVLRWWLMVRRYRRARHGKRP